MALYVRPVETLTLLEAKGLTLQTLDSVIGLREHHATTFGLKVASLALTRLLSLPPEGRPLSE